MNFIELPKQTGYTPLFSPRSTLSRTNAELDRLTTNLAINIDKYILGFFKDAFEQNQDELTREEFISQGLKHLRSWQRQLKHRNEKIHHCLDRLYREADSNNNRKISWNQFNSMLIEKGLNLKSLQHQEPTNTALMKVVPLASTLTHHGCPIQKIIHLKDKIAVFGQQSSEIHFYNYDGTQATLKPLLLSQQSLSVQTSLHKRTKGGKKQIVKKDIVVAQYKNVVLDMMFISDGKYEMLITSSTDCLIRGWDIGSNIPILAKQPQNQDQKMQHQFSEEIHSMAWDNVNEVLYCTGKSTAIRQWMVKTDSERELSDVDGHTEMISAMVMMPKLQLLATGGYDGKLVLWDTIAQNKKFKYTEHTRSISSMAFHQGLILLFTAAYDHSICVWNPYIQSLIHKIMGNSNFLQLDIIPGTNLLLALDAQSNIKIREINKFTLISAFPIDKHEQRIEPTCLAASTKPLRYFFGGTAAAAYEYVHIDSNVIQDSTALCLRYHSASFTLYCPFKNNIVGWDLLTGLVSITLRALTPADISAFHMFQTTKLAVLGDNQGNLLLRKLENGVLVKKLYKHKMNVTCLLIEEMNREKMIFSASQDGQLAIFERDPHGDFNRTRSLSLKKVDPQATVSALCYEPIRNTLIIGTNIGDIYFMDVDKTKIISKCEPKSGDIEYFTILRDHSILLSFTKKAEVLGLYLPPHLKKFKPSCHLVSETQAKITSVAMSATNQRCYLGLENGDIMAFWLSDQTISGHQEEDFDAKTIRHLWKQNLGDTIRDLYLIEQEETLIIIVGLNNVILLGCENGQPIAELNVKGQRQEITPLMFLDEDKDSIFLRQLNLDIPVCTKSREQEIRRFMDPSFYLNLVEPYHQKMNTTSNPHWKFYPKIYNQASKNVQNTIDLLDTIQLYEKQPKKLRLVKAQSQPSFDLTKAADLQKRWQRQKEEQDGFRSSKQQSMHQYHNSSSAGLRNTKHSSLSKSGFKDYVLKMTEKGASNSPLFKLGAALRSVNEKDGKALKLMEMAERQMIKKGGLKLPKISSHKE